LTPKDRRGTATGTGKRTLRGPYEVRPFGVTRPASEPRASRTPPLAVWERANNPDHICQTSE